MEALKIELTQSTPRIYLDQKLSKFEIAGKSFPEESRSFYAPLFSWLEEYAKNPNDETLFEFNLEYFNSASSLIILEILNLLDEIFKNGNKVSISWNYLDIDEDMLEAGEEYSELVKVPFVFNSVEEFDY